MTPFHILGAEAAMPSLRAEDLLNEGIDQFDPNQVYQLAMDAYGDETIAKDLACQRAERIMQASERR